MDATWHARPRGSATRAQAVLTRRRDIYLYLHIYIGYNTYSLPIIGRELLPLLSVAYYKPICFTNFSRVGLKFNTVFMIAGHVAEAEAWD